MAADIEKSNKRKPLSEILNISGVTDKSNHIKDILQKMEEAKEELFKCGIILNEDIKVDQKKLDAYLGL